jgi:hypothetical protein
VKKNWFLVVMALMFSLVFWTLSGVFLYGVVRQAGTADWASAQGKVVSSRVTSHRGSKGGTTYKPEVVFTYTLGGATHTSSNITLASGFSDSGGGYAQRIVSENPPGKDVTVYYNPKSPGEAVLIRGVTDREWQLVSLLGLFVSVPVFLWLLVASSFRAQAGDRVGTVRVIEPAPGISVVRSFVITPLAAAFIAWGVALVATIILTMTVFGGNARASVLIGWSASLALAIAFGLWRRSWITAGRCDTVIDRGAGLLIPARGLRGEATALPLSTVKDTAVRQDSPVSTNKTRHWRVHLLIEGEAKSRPVADIRLKADAETFNQWVRSRIGLTTS